MISMEGFVEHVQPWLPDFVVRVVVWLYLRYFVGRIRNLDHPFKELRTVNRIKAEANEKFAPVADKTDAANEQHYEVPTEFFVNHLGPCRKYSSCEWTGCSTLAQAEAKTFDSYLEKMGIGDVPTDGTGRVLEVGNGWGSFLLYAAAKHPTITFTGFSNSSTQQVRKRLAFLSSPRGETQLQARLCQHRSTQLISVAILLLFFFFFFFFLPLLLSTPLPPPLPELLARFCFGSAGARPTSCLRRRNEG